MLFSTSKVNFAPKFEFDSTNEFVHESTSKLIQCGCKFLRDRHVWFISCGISFIFLFFGLGATNVGLWSTKGFGVCYKFLRWSRGYEGLKYVVFFPLYCFTLFLLGGSSL